MGGNSTIMEEKKGKSIFLKRKNEIEDEVTEAKTLKVESLSCDVDPTVVLMSTPLDVDIENDDFIKIKMSKAIYSEYGESTANRKTKNLVSAILSDINTSQTRNKDIKSQNNDKIKTNNDKSTNNGNIIYPRSSNLERLYCDECNYQCRYVSVLLNHKKTHLKDSRSCKICGFTTKHINNMKIHELTHIDEKPFSCEMCEFKGKTLNDLKRHRTTHPQVKLFMCDICEYSCSQSVTLEQHKVIHESEKQHVCNNCGVVLMNSDELNDHVKAVHGQNENPVK